MRGAQFNPFGEQRAQGRFGPRQSDQPIERRFGQRGVPVRQQLAHDMRFANLDEAGGDGDTEVAAARDDAAVLGGAVLDDLDEVAGIERVAFLQQWPGHGKGALGEIAQDAARRVAADSEARGAEIAFAVRDVQQHIEEDIPRHRTVLRRDA